MIRNARQHARGRDDHASTSSRDESELVLRVADDGRRLRSGGDRRPSRPPRVCAACTNGPRRSAAASTIESAPGTGHDGRVPAAVVLDWVPMRRRRSRGYALIPSTAYAASSRSSAALHDVRRRTGVLHRLARVRGRRSSSRPSRRCRASAARMPAIAALAAARHAHVDDGEVGLVDVARRPWRRRRLRRKRRRGTGGPSPAAPRSRGGRRSSSSASSTVTTARHSSPAPALRPASPGHVASVPADGSGCMTRPGHSGARDIEHQSGVPAHGP